MSRDHLWVYGTLRYGCANPHAHLLRRGSRYRGAARVQGRLYRIKWYPGIRLGGEEWVVGDLFQILDPSVLPALDLYEGSNEYRRVQAVAELASGQRVKCWVYEYVGGVSESRRIASGDWLAENGGD